MQGRFPAPDPFFFEGPGPAGFDLKNEYHLNEKLCSPSASIVTNPRVFLIMTCTVIHTGVILMCREVRSRSLKAVACFHAPF